MSETGTPGPVFPGPVFPGPVFIVGASRSGTSLMRTLLNQHGSIHLSIETHYFDDLRPRMKDPADEELEGARWHRCENYFLALSHRLYSQGDPEQGTVSRETLRDALPRARATADGAFEAFCRVNASREGATIWGEKTPRHIFRIDDILGRYPQAKIIAMVRDPRAVVASYRDWRKDLEAENERTIRSYNILIATMLWKSGVIAALTARNAHGPEHIRFVRYEDLVNDPRPVVEGLVEWLGLPFEEALLDVPVLNSSYQRSSKGGFSKEAIGRWRERLSDREVALIQQCAGKALTDAGYDAADVANMPLHYAWEQIKLPIAATRAALANRKRIAGLPQYAWRRLRLLMVGTGN
ncbi:MAG: sulfotransferase family protein [Gammaproteobacteria bacterium]